jgi:hypothetical protein
MDETGADQIKQAVEALAVRARVIAAHTVALRKS